MHHQRIVVRFTTHGTVFVFTKAGEIERFAVDQELGIPHFYGAQAHGQAVAVFAVFDFEGVKVGFAWLPRCGARHLDAATALAAAAHFAALGIAQAHAGCHVGRGVAVDFNLEIDCARARVLTLVDGPIRHDRHISNVNLGRAVQPDWAVQAGIVEEIMKNLLTLSPISQGDHAPRRNRVPVQLVVDAHCQAVGLACSE